MGSGIKIFGQRIDPVEICLQIAVVIVIGVPAIRDSAKADFTVERAAAWFGAIAGAVTVIRKAPTGKLNPEQKIFSDKGSEEQ